MTEQITEMIFADVKARLTASRREQKRMLVGRDSYANAIYETVLQALGRDSALEARHGKEDGGASSERRRRQKSALLTSCIKIQRFWFDSRRYQIL
jgi:hypothetical protein